ncbi:MAG: amidohydrolase family protein [Alphaproteobacteria bacterium]|nr:amidohydrolase family protein [Alphaproteobacteria bacterium]MBV9420416.1 amidohydrolase family protein [Alphaproteobacteria bacterium]
MAYAHRAIYDADSHIMELPDFLQKYADPSIRAEVPAVSYSASIVTDEEVAVIMGQGGRHSDDHIAAQIALGDKLIEKSKEIQALGAFDGKDRRKAMDLLGFKKQLVFATHSVAKPFSPSSKLTHELRYGCARAHNRHMSDFCAEDPRLMGVAIIPLDSAEHAIAELEWVLKSNLKAVWVPHRSPVDMSPGHVSLEPFWARLAESGMPFLLHVGGAPIQLAKSWTNNGKAATKDWLGGGENVRTKDAAVLHQGPETFISMLMIEGVFERHPKLRGASVELGAGWVPELLRRLDWVAKHWGRTDATLAAFKRTPSQQLTEQMAFTPFVFEEVGSFIDQSNDLLYLFSSDYPHIEGGRDPIKRFEGTLGERPAVTRERFYAENFLRIFPEARAA